MAGMDRQLYYNAIKTNIVFARELGCVLPDGDYFCPLCKQAFTEEDVKNVLTEEDVPQAALGGSRITLTCRECNSTCGSQIDCHLINGIKAIEQRAYLPGTDRKVILEDDGKKINAELSVGNDAEMTLRINTKHNNPRFWEYYHDNILLPETIANIQDAPLKRDERRISAAIIKNAYLLLFARTGYTFLFDPFYDAIREQIKNPESFIIPERLWTFQNIAVPDGIYYTMDNRYRGFFVVYALKLIRSYKVCSLIPTPKVEYLAACMQLRELGPNNPISVCSLPNLDFLSDKEAMIRLRTWCYGWDMKI